MAAPTLPTLTWKRSTVQTVTTATIPKLLSAIYTNISASSYWYPASYSTGNSNTMDYVEIRPRLTTDTPAASAEPALIGQRILIGGQGSDGGTVSASAMGDATITDNPVPQPGAADLIMNYTPEGGSGSALLGVNEVNSFFPYGGLAGSQTRSTGYYGICDDLNAGGTFNTWIIESEEILTVCIENTTDSESGYGFVVGAIMRPATSGSNDADVQNRLYGGHWFGQDFGEEWQENLTTGWSDSTTDNVNAPKSVAFDPQSDTTGSSCKLLSLKRLEEFTNNNTTNMVTGDGAYIAIPMNYCTQAYKASGSISPYRFVGTMRQIRYMRDFQARIIIQDGGGTTVGFAWGSHPNNAYDAAGFTNS